MPDVFVSYNRDDREVARAVAAGLEAEGFSVWWDAALRAGEYYEEVTEKNLRSAAAVVVLWSKRSVGSKWVRAEATVGERSSVLVPALIEDCDRPVRFELVQTADLTRWTGDRNDSNWRAFVLDVREAVGRRSEAVAPAASPTAAPRPQDNTQRSQAGATSDASATIETAFWNSIKDGSERADFEAYLSRYPRGHFADLARNRLAALDRTQRAASRPQAVAARSRPAAPAAGAARPAAQPAQRAATRPAAPPPQEKKGGGIMIAGVAVALAAAGAAAYFMMGVKSGPQPTAAPSTTGIESTPAPGARTETVVADRSAATSSTAPIETADASLAEPPSEESSVDVFSDEGTPPPAPVELKSEAALETAASAAPDAPPATTAQPTAQPAAASAVPAVEAKPRKVKAAKGAKRDCESCPIMATLPEGAFVMGSPEGEAGRNAYEGPQHEVKVKRFRIGVHEVKAGEWAACVADGACPAKRDLGDPNLPALGVSWREAKGYAIWLSKKTGKSYRLPTEAEWEYAARAGTVTAYWWGDAFDPGKVARGSVKPVGSFPPNAFGLHDMQSNAREWVEDCYVNNFTQTPRDGSAATNGDCSLRVIRGGYWSSSPADARIANRSRISQTGQPTYMGVRVAADAD